MKKTIFTLIFFLMFITQINASIVVMDADSGRVLYGKNENDKMLIASTTKIMTSIIALENSNLKKRVIVGNEIDEVNGSMIYINKGEKITVEDLLYGLMLQSGNDAAQTIATNILGYDMFIEKMNLKASSLGMRNTIFENPHGLNDNTKNYSTAYDLSLLMKYAIKNKNFMKITSTKKYKTKTSDDIYIWYNKNKLLTEYKNSTSGKIGYTKASGQVFVSSASKEGENLIVSTIKESDKFNLHKNLYEKYFKEYEKYQILNSYTFNIKDNKHKDYYFYIKNDFNMLLKKDELNKVNLKVTINNNIVNDIVGSVNVYIDKEIIHSEPLYAININKKKNMIKRILLFWK